MQRIRNNRTNRNPRRLASSNLHRVLQTIVPVLSLALCLSGCGDKGPKLAPVSGHVTFQGKPVAAGMVRFSNPPAGIDILATLQADGAYSVHMAKGNGLPEGTYAVAVVPPRVNSPVGTMTPPPLPEYPDIPEKYRQPSTSGLTLTVKPGGNPFDIDMQLDK
jgi:hypothetical protein